ncbi:endonuclease/exonuclease/phosphatase family protein [Streptomyces sp. NPDC057702]|uniref:endonuclease/exonuclease/phosphatase family protein n=1 Tax=unclassified Streptomyces TaxID=2593676 RepID=UPI00369D245F
MGGEGAGAVPDGAGAPGGGDVTGSWWWRGARGLGRLPRGWGRWVLAGCAVVLLVLVSVVLGHRAADVDGLTPVPQLLAFLPWLLLPGALALLLAALARWPLGCAWALVALLATGWYLQPYEGAGAGGPSGPVVARPRVLSANLEYGQATDGLVAALRRERPDLVAVQECDQRCVSALESPALRAAYPYRNIVPGRPAQGSAILSVYPLRDEAGVPGSLAMPGARALIAGRWIRVQVAHPMPPEPGGLDLWRTELGRLRAYAERRGELPTLIAGDFNASQDHAAFRHLLDTGLRDSARLAGVSRTPSWPTLTTPLFGAQIDHVLVSDAWSTRDARFLDLPKTDHRALLVDLRLHAHPQPHRALTAPRQTPTDDNP